MNKTTAPIKTLKFTRFGNPILRTKAAAINPTDIGSNIVQQLISDMRYTVEKEASGVGLAAPQVGGGKALALIAIKPTKNRPDRERFESIIINPRYEGIGRRVGMWEGCISAGRGNDTLFGRALRYQKIHASWYDENGVEHMEVLDGFVAHVFQHETDHLDGILFVDRVKDRTTFMMADEYRTRIVSKEKSGSNK